MPHKTDPAGLGLSDEDLQIEEAEERRRRDEELKAKRTIQFGEIYFRERQHQAVRLKLRRTDAD